VALDNNYAIWQAFNNQYWPAHYFIDAKGHIRGHHFGEGDYDKSEELIRQLLSEADAHDLPPAVSNIRRKALGFRRRNACEFSGNLYRHERAQHFVSSGGFGRGAVKSYSVPDSLI
jgi:hypothetical protein